MAYKECRNFLNNLIRENKRAYYDSKFDNVRNNVKATWKLINTILNKKTLKHGINDIEVDGEKIIDKQRIVNIFNSYFRTIGQKLQQSIDNLITCNIESTKYDEYLKGNFF